MVRHDDMRVARDLQCLAGNTLGFEHCHLFDQDAGINDHAVADDRRAVLIHDAGRHKMKGQLRVAMDDGMTRIVASLVTYDEIVVAGDQIGYFAFALVAPLSANEYSVHDMRPFA